MTMTGRQGRSDSIRSVDGDTFNVDPHGPSAYSPRVNRNNIAPTTPQRLPTQEDFAAKYRQGLTASTLQGQQQQQGSPSSQGNFVW